MRCDQTPSIHDYQNDHAWGRVRHLPVNRYGYKHIDTNANVPVRNAEVAAWRAAHERRSRIEIDFAWRLENFALRKLHFRLEAARKRWFRYD